MADKNIIDGIEYETEPSYVDSRTGKPVFYAKSVPELLRGEIGHDFDKANFVSNLLGKKLIEILEYGHEIWNAWVLHMHVHEKRWCIEDDLEGRVNVRLKDEENESFLIDFSQGSRGHRYTIQQRDFREFVFPAEVSFQSAHFEKPVDFTGVRFPRAVNFSRTLFEQHAKFGAVIFDADVSFSYATLKKEISFEKAVFNKPANFERTEFENTVDFSKLNVLGDLNFSSCKFGALVQFEDLVFNGYLNLSAASFSGQVDFKRIVLKDSFYFNPAHVGGPVSFDQVQFGGDTRFSHGKFNAGLYFERSTFLDYVHFEHTEVHNLLSIRNCHFVLPAFFNEMRSMSVAYFDIVTFEQDAHFQDAEFHKSAKWRDVVFLKSCRWDGAIFHRRAEYSQCQFVGRDQRANDEENPYWHYDDVEFQDTKFDGYASFNKVWFGIDQTAPLPSSFASWAHSLQTSYQYRRKAGTHYTVPNFKGTKFKVVPNLGYAEVPVPNMEPAKNFIDSITRFFGINLVANRIVDGDAAAKLRVLGELAARGHHHLAEKRFFRAELLARRGWETKNGYEVAMINAFELFSKCGLSFWRPIEWLIRLMALCALAMLTSIQPHLVNMHGDEWIVASLCVGIVFWRPRWGLIGIGLWFFLLYWQAGHWTFGDLSAHTLAQLSIYTGLNSLPVIGLASDGYAVASEYLFGKPDMVPPEVRVLAFFQNAVSAVFIFFGLLAIRNYFKLG